MAHTASVRLLPVAAFLLTAGLAFAAVCGPAAQQAADETATAEATVVVGEGTATPDSPTFEPSATTIVEPTPSPADPPTATAWPAFGTPTPGPPDIFPSPAPGDAMTIGGSVWVDARPATGNLVARIGDKVCGEGQSGRLTSGDAPVFVLTIPSAEQLAGCGVAGSVVTVEINGRAVNDQLIFAPGFQQQITLSSGSAFALVNGEVTGLNGGDFSVLPYINGSLCGVDLGAPAVPGGRPPTFRVVVDSDQLTPGCGTPGATVTLVLTVGTTDTEIAQVPWMDGTLVVEPVAAPSFSGTPSTSTPQ